MKPIEVEAMVGVPASLSVEHGEARVPGGTPFKKSAVSWEVEFSDSTRLDEIVPALLSRVGGFDHLKTVKDRVQPELLEFNLAMWILDSDTQEGGGIDAQSIALLGKLGASLGLGFHPRNAA